MGPAEQRRGGEDWKEAEALLWDAAGAGVVVWAEAAGGGHMLRALTWEGRR